jgi:hypothetical protein
LDGVFLGEVRSATATELDFTIPALDASVVFEGAPYARPQNDSGAASAGAAHTHSIDPAGNPPKGTQIAVAFSMGDPDQPMVLEIYGWPA